jgi:thiamine-monophosphate kinase
VTPRSPRIRLGDGVEFERISRALDAGIADAAATVPGLRVGPGDDAAVLADGTVLSQDMAVEGVHFRLDWISPAEAGGRAVACALSDLAAMAAEPVATLLAVAWPGGRGEAGLQELLAGAGRVAAAYGAPIIGGDLVAAAGAAVIDVTVVGRADPPVLRAGARPGDALWVTGRLGAAAAAVAAWSCGADPEPAARRAYATPVPRLAEARWLARHVRPSALIDLSDGLAGDVRHIAAASGVRATLDTERIPLHPAAGSDGLDLALSGGDDYELLFAAATTDVEPWLDAFADRFGAALTRVGSVDTGAGVARRDRGGTRPLERTGFRHFEGEAT